MAFREPPPGLEIAMFVLEGREAAVTAEELRLSAGDVSRFFDRRLSRREPASVVADSAGWPIALRIYRNALRHGTRGALGAPTARSRAGSRTQLWRGIPDAERDFVLDVALFDRLDPALIDEVTGEGNAARRIASRGTLAWLWSGSERGARRPAYVRRPAQQSFDAPPLSGGLFALRRSHEPRKLPVHQTATKLHATRYVRVIGVQRKKLIEVALPLDAINRAAAREKSIRYGHPSTLHLWWARRPLAAARAVIFARMVDDPSSRPELFPTAQARDQERRRLFDIMKQLVTWENTTNESILTAAHDEIHTSWRRTCADYADHPRAAELFNPERLPAFHDPFAGGGTLPLEAQRLGLEAYASDLNPVAVLISKAPIEIPPKFAGRPAVNPKARLLARTWPWPAGLAEVDEAERYYLQGMTRAMQRLAKSTHMAMPVTITPRCWMTRTTRFWREMHWRSSIRSLPIREESS